MNLLTVADHLVRIFLDLTQSHFSTKPDDRCVNSLGSKYTFYKDDDIKSTIWITDQYPSSPTKGQIRPAIVGRRGRFVWRNRFLGGNMRELDISTGTATYSDIMPFSVTLQCLSTEGIESEQIANELLLLILLMTPQVIANSAIQDVSEIGVGEESPLVINGTHTPWVNVPVDITCLVKGEYTAYDKDPEVLRSVDQVIRTS